MRSASAKMGSAATAEMGAATTAEMGTAAGMPSTTAAPGSSCCRRDHAQQKSNCSGAGCYLGHVCNPFRANNTNARSPAPFRKPPAIDGAMQTAVSPE